MDRLEQRLDDAEADRRGGHANWQAPRAPAAGASRGLGGVRRKAARSAACAVAARATTACSGATQGGHPARGDGPVIRALVRGAGPAAPSGTRPEDLNGTAPPGEEAPPEKSSTS